MSRRYINDYEMAVKPIFVQAKDSKHVRIRIIVAFGIYVGQYCFSSFSRKESDDHW